MAQTNIFSDPRYIKLQKEDAERKAPGLATSLDTLLSQNSGKRLAELGAGMGHLAYEMHRRGYEVLVEEPFAQSVNMLKDREPTFYSHLKSKGLLFEKSLLEFARDIAERKLSGIYDAVYSNGGPLLIMQKVDGTYVVESYIDTRSPDNKILRGPSLGLDLESLRGLRAGIKPNGQIILSVQSVPQGKQDGTNYNGSPVEFYINSDYDQEPGVVKRTRILTGGGLEQIRHQHDKLVMTLDEFKEHAKKAGFQNSDFSKDGLWFFVR